MSEVTPFRTFSNRSNAIAAARKVYGKTAQPNAEFSLSEGVDGRWAFFRVSPEAELASFAEQDDDTDVPFDAEAAVSEQEAITDAREAAIDELARAGVDGPADVALPPLGGTLASIGAVLTEKEAAPKVRGGKGRELRGKLVGIREILLREGGCARSDILEFTGWTACSVQAQAKACGLDLRQEKIDGKYRYFGSVPKGGSL
jgi:hypothetical protein